ncbi:10479_t:CDS:1, partial [Entrophospora sp. SA101]
RDRTKAGNYEGRDSKAEATVLICTSRCMSNDMCRLVLPYICP